MPTYKTRVHRDGRRRDETQPYLHTARHSMSPTAKLAVAIVQQAVEDWDGLIKRKAWRLGGQQPVSTQSSAAGANSTFVEIRLFFRRGFVELLLPDGSALTPEGMLEILERRLQTAMEADTEWMQQQKEMQADAASAHTSA